MMKNIMKLGTDSQKEEKRRDLAGLMIECGQCKTTNSKTCCFSFFICYVNTVFPPLSPVLFSHCMRASTKRGKARSPQQRRVTTTKMTFFVAPSLMEHGQYVSNTVVDPI